MCLSVPSLRLPSRTEAFMATHWIHPACCQTQLEGIILIMVTICYPRWICGIFWKDIWIAPPIDPDEVSSLLKKRGSLSARDSVSSYSQARQLWNQACLRGLALYGVAIGQELVPFYLALRGLCFPPRWQNLEKSLPSNTFTVHWIFLPLYPEAWAQRYFTTSLWKSLESTL